MSNHETSLSDKKQDGIEMSVMSNNSSPDIAHTTAMDEDDVYLRKSESRSTISGDKEVKTSRSKASVSQDDKADGNDPLSPDSLTPLTSSNQYGMRKTAAQALMDVALMMANISQLRTLLTAGETIDYYMVLIVMVILSLVFQLLFAVLIFFIWMKESDQHQRDDYLETLREVFESSVGTSTDIKDKIRVSVVKRKEDYQSHRLTSHLNYITMVLVFIITVINMFITGFGIKLQQQSENTLMTGKTA